MLSNKAAQSDDPKVKIQKISLAYELRLPSEILYFSFLNLNQLLRHLRKAFNGKAGDQDKEKRIIGTRNMEEKRTSELQLIIFRWVRKDFTATKQEKDVI